MFSVGHVCLHLPHLWCFHAQTVQPQLVSVSAAKTHQPESEAAHGCVILTSKFHDRNEKNIIILMTVTSNDALYVYSDWKQS